MSKPPTTRTNADGFKGEYPRNENELWEKVYRDAGAEPPWLLEYEDGKVVGRREPHEPTVSHHEA
ncbi:MAG: hypothetical protein JWP32_2894 [Schumannella sp.]|nr:hypothetical protein [Schumannella sp.]